jgi:hypothetical protein
MASLSPARPTLLPTADRRARSPLSPVRSSRSPAPERNKGSESDAGPFARWSVSDPVPGAGLPRGSGTRNAQTACLSNPLWRCPRKTAAPFAARSRYDRYGDLRQPSGTTTPNGDPAAALRRPERCLAVPSLSHRQRLQARARVALGHRRSRLQRFRYADGFRSARTVVDARGRLALAARHASVAP